MFIKNKKLRGIIGAILLIVLTVSFSLTPFTVSKYVHTSSGKALSSQIDGTIEKKDITLTGITVEPKKNVYHIKEDSYEEFQNTDLTVTAMYSDGSAAAVTDFEVSFVPGDDGNNNRFDVFGQKTGVVKYEQKDEQGNVKGSVSKQFIVYAVNTKELTLAGMPEVEGEQRIQRYFHQFGINAVPQTFFTLPGEETLDANNYGTAATLSFSTGTVNYTVNEHSGDANYDDTDTNGQITINCTAAPFADIFGYVGYADRVPIAFGMYVDTMDNLQVTLPMANNADIIKLTGTDKSRIFYIQAPLNTMNLSAGEHKVHFISIFDDGVQELTKWTVNIEKEEIDISNETANVLILAGQSNAYGASALTDAVKGLAAGVDYSKIFIHYSNVNCENGMWKPLYSNTKFEPYYPGLGGTLDGFCFGPEVGIAHELATNGNTKDQVWYIIKCTAAGTILDGQWIEGTYDNEGLVTDMGDYLSNLMLNYIDRSLEEIRGIHGDNIKIRSFVWMQGESDALAPDCADKYQANEAKLVNMVRDKYKDYAENKDGNKISFVNGAIAKFADINIKLTGGATSNGWTYSDAVNSGKKDNTRLWYDPVAGTIGTNSSAVLQNSAWVDTSTLLVGANAGENTDVHHYSSGAMWNLGKWFGIAAVYLMIT